MPTRQSWSSLPTLSQWLWLTWYSGYIQWVLIPWLCWHRWSHNLTSHSLAGLYTLSYFGFSPMKIRWGQKDVHRKLFPDGFDRWGDIIFALRIDLRPCIVVSAHQELLHPDIRVSYLTYCTTYFGRVFSSSSSSPVRFIKWCAPTFAPKDSIINFPRFLALRK